MPGNHAFLSPSSSVRWYFCPPSARLCEQYPDQGSVYAAEGTEAHALCEYFVKQMICEPCLDPRPTMQYYSPEMEEAAAGYARYIMEKVEAYEDTAPTFHGQLSPDDVCKIFVEQRLDLREYIPQCMGTADCVIISRNVAEVIDFKYGMHPVPATSMQLRIYALGVCEMFSHLYDFRKVKMSVYQPRLHSVDETEMTVAELYTWAKDELAPRARQAFDGVGQFSCGDWCRCCRARRNCRELAAHELEIAKYEFADPNILSDEEIADVLSRVDALTAWAEDVKKFALAEALKGHAYPGFKVVAGRANRRFSDDAAVAARVRKAGLDPYEEKKLLSVTALEKLLGKKAFSDLLSDLVTRPEGKPTLVPDSDKRPEWITADKEFAELLKESEEIVYE